MRLLVVGISLHVMWRYASRALATKRAWAWSKDVAIFWFAVVGVGYQIAHAMGVTEEWRLALLTATFVALLVADIALGWRSRG
jgi:hypothetical protein